MMVSILDYASFVNNALINIVSFLTIIIMGFVLGRFLGKLTSRILGELEFNTYVSKRLNIRANVEKNLGTFIKISIYLVAIIYSLRQIGVQYYAVYLVIFLILLVFLVYLVLLTKDYIKNIFIGLFLMDRKSLVLHSELSINDINGTIVKVSKTEIKVISKDNDTFFIPNTVLMRNKLFKKKKKK